MAEKENELNETLYTCFILRGKKQEGKEMWAEHMRKQAIKEQEGKKMWAEHTRKQAIKLPSAKWPSKQAQAKSGQ